MEKLQDWLDRIDEYGLGPETSEGPSVDADPVFEVVVLVADRLGDALVGGGVGLRRRVDREPVDQPIRVAEPVEVVEVDMRHDAGVGQLDVVSEELAPEVGAEVDEQRLAGALVGDVDREPRARHPALARRGAGVAVAADRRRSGGVTGAEEGDPHLGSGSTAHRLSVRGRPVGSA